ncbi:hypothetical protein GGR53DRAFT_498451, partial [Hypoxylon sp. FL1150]
ALTNFLLLMLNCFEPRDSFLCIDATPSVELFYNIYSKGWHHQHSMLAHEPISQLGCRTCIISPKPASYIAGGELRWFTSVLYTARNDAISRVVAETKARGEIAMIYLRFENGELGGFAQVCAYGTAAVIEKVDPAVQVPPQDASLCSLGFTAYSLVYSFYVFPPSLRIRFAT